jgi:molecular chaperone HscA
MLLQLVEPGQTPLPHEQERPLAVGIDLGTTNSLVAVAHGQKAFILKEGHISGIVPSVVYYGKDGCIKVGAEALEKLAEDPANVIISAKRSMGQGLQSSKEMITYSTSQGSKTPVEVSAEILKALKIQAKASLSREVSQAVITVPAYFDDAARTATRHAARLAGLEVLRLVNEPTAAALAYGLDKGVQGLYAVYDLGGGTFDFSLLKLEKGIFQVLATGGDTQLGGDDFDTVLLEIIALQLNLSLTPDNPDYKALMQTVRQIKERLSTETHINQSIAINDQRFTVTLSVDTYSQAIQPIVERSLEICKQVLKDAQVAVDDLQGVVMVGGATRTSAVIKAVKDLFQREPLNDINPDEAVALGAALQAEALTVGSQNLLLDVNPLSLGIETMGGLVEKIIPRNSPIPLSKAQEFTTFQDGQTAMLIHVVQGEREMVQDCRSLARFELQGIPPMVAGAARIQVTFTIDADGILTVSAKEKTTGVQQHIEVTPTYGLSTDEVNQMLLTAFQESEEDMAKRLLAETKADSVRLIVTIKAALQEDGDLLGQEEYQQIQNHLYSLEQAQQGDNREIILQTTKALDQATQNFAEKRIERAMRAALRGKHLIEVEGNLV